MSVAHAGVLMRSGSASRNGEWPLGCCDLPPAGYSRILDLDVPSNGPAKRISAWPSSSAAPEPLGHALVAPFCTLGAAVREPYSRWQGVSPVWLPPHPRLALSL